MSLSKSMICMLCGNFRVTETSIWYFTLQSYDLIKLDGGRFSVPLSVSSEHRSTLPDSVVDLKDSN